MGKAPHQKWLDFAQDDLSWTEANLREKIWYGACFTAQQAAEKALKAYLIKQDKNPPKIHSLVALLEACIPFDKSFEKVRKACASLTVYYAPTRYPDIIDFSEFSQEQAKEALELSREIVLFVEAKFQE